MTSRGVNKSILVGNLGQETEVRYMANGDTVTNIKLATWENWRDKQSAENKEITEWHRVVLFGKLAEVAGEYLRKGSQIYIEGQLRTQKGQGTDGKGKYTTEVVVNAGGTMQMLGGRGGASDAQDINQSGEQSEQFAATQQSSGRKGRGGKAHTSPSQSAPSGQTFSPGGYPPPPDYFEDPISFWPDGSDQVRPLNAWFFKSVN